MRQFLAGGSGPIRLNPTNLRESEWLIDEFQVSSGGVFL